MRPRPAAPAASGTESVSGPANDRRSVLAGAALRVLGGSGSRGLTHRAVDVEAGLPAGSVNYYASNRAALLDLAARELFDLDTRLAVELLAPLAEPSPSRRTDATVAVLAGFVEAMSSPQRAYLVLARHELLGESARSQPLRALFAEQRAAFVAFAESLARAGGCRTPVEHADLLAVVVDALVVRQVVVGPVRLTPDEVSEALTRVLRSC